MSVELGRPGSDPQRPHQDLRIPSRIPSQYLSQVLPSSSGSSSSFTTPPVAVQIASLHRAAEVARYEWRATQRSRSAVQNTSSSPAFQRVSDFRAHSSSSFRRRNTVTSSNVAIAQQRDSRLTSRVFTSATEAYNSALQDLNRHTGAGLLDISDAENVDSNGNADNGSDTSIDSNSTEDEVVASPITSSALPLRRAEMVENRNAYSPWSSSLNSVAGLSRDDNIVAESQVWDRMVNDLAIGAGVIGTPQNQSGDTLQGEFAHQRGISGGIAASMLALSAAIPRTDHWNPSSSHRGSAPPRTLPHPIWARRYPGAAGEWLRGELARRANGSSTQSQTTLGSTGIPRPATTHNSHRRWRTQTNESSSGSTNPIQRDANQSSSSDIFSERLRTQSTRRNNWDQWNALRFPSLDPASRDGSTSTNRPSSEILQGGDNLSTAMSHTNASSNALTVPINSRAQGPTPPLYEITNAQNTRSTASDVAELSSEMSNLRVSAMTDSDSTPSQEGNVQSVNQNAAELVARMAQASREMASARESSSSMARSGESGRANSNSRATRGGLSYIRRLRQFDGLENEPARPTALDVSNVVRDDENPPLRPHEVFPWYQPPRVNASLQQSNRRIADEEADEIEKDTFDPDGSNLSWYNMARDRMTSLQHEREARRVNDDPNGERIELEEGEVDDSSSRTVGIRRRVVTSSESHSQRRRNRSALVVADAELDGEGNGNSRNNAWNPVESWTLVDQRPMSPVRRSRDEGSENVTTWLREPANPTVRLSTSPLPMNDSDTIVRLPATRTIHTYRPVPNSEDPRTTRRPRRLASLDDGDVQQYSSLYNSIFDGTDGREIREDTPSPELQSTESIQGAQRREGGSGAEVIGRARRLTSIGRRLEEEFRARQTELRQREERLRNEVARRRLELDQVRRRQGRIGRVIDRHQESQSPFPHLNETLTIEGESNTRDSPDQMIPNIALSDENNNANSTATETIPLLAEQETTLIRRRALREPRRGNSILSHEEESTEEIIIRDEIGRGDEARQVPPTPLDELMSRLTLQSARVQRNLRRIQSLSEVTRGTPLNPLPITALDDHFAR